MASIVARQAARTKLATPYVTASRSLATNSKPDGTGEQPESQKEQKGGEEAKGTEQPKKEHKKTMAEADDELKRKMSGLSGDGGEAGLEFEDGQAVSGLGKRSVRNNIFRYI